MMISSPLLVRVFGPRDRVVKIHFTAAFFVKASTKQRQRRILALYMALIGTLQVVTAFIYLLI